MRFVEAGVEARPKSCFRDQQGKLRTLMQSKHLIVYAMRLSPDLHGIWITNLRCKGTTQSYVGTEYAEPELRNLCTVQKRILTDTRQLSTLDKDNIRVMGKQSPPCTGLTDQCRTHHCKARLKTVYYHRVIDFKVSTVISGYSSHNIAKYIKAIQGYRRRRDIVPSSYRSVKSRTPPLFAYSQKARVDSDRLSCRSLV